MIQQPLFTQLDSYTVHVYWGPFNSGDEGGPALMWAFPGLSWQLTGYSHGDLSLPNVPVSRNRSVTIYGSNDPGTLDQATCWAPIFTFDSNPDGMNNRMGDPVRDGSKDQRFRYIKPVATGDINPAGPDCGVLLLGYRLFGPRV